MPLITHCHLLIVNFIQVLFDKTGTLTEGQPSVSPMESFLYTKETCSNVTELWGLIASAELKSEHILGKAIVDFVKEQSEIQLDEPTSFDPITGAGVSAVVKGRRVLVGSERSATCERKGILSDVSVRIYVCMPPS